MTLTRVLQCSGGDKSPSGIGSRENWRKRIEEGEHTDPLFRNLWHQEESEKLLVLVFSDERNCRVSHNACVRAFQDILLQ